MGKRVILITSVPEAGWNVPRHMVFAHLRGDDAAPSLPRKGIEERLAASVQALVPDPLPPGQTVIRPEDILCSTGPGALCRQSDAGIPLYADADHLTNRGAGLLVQALAPYLPGP